MARPKTSSGVRYTIRPTKAEAAFIEAYSKRHQVRPAAGGRMIARHDGRVVLVAGAIPGERVRARVERAERGVTWAAVVEVVTASPDRRVL